MRRPLLVDRLPTAASFVAALMLLAAAVRGAPGVETFSAEASLKTAGGVKATAPVIVTIERFATDAEREALIAAVKQGGTSGARELLAKGDDLGMLTVGAHATPIKYAFARPSALGRVVTVVTARPIAFVGAGLPDAKPTAGYDLGLLLLQVVNGSPGHGELLPATKIRVDAKGAIVSEGYIGEVMSVSNVVGR